MEAGEQVQIARDGVPVARLVLIQPAEGPGPRFLAARGSLSGRIFMSDDFEFNDAELDELFDEPTWGRSSTLTSCSGSRRGAGYPRASLRDVIERATELLFSAVSFAEIGLKAAIGKLRVPEDFHDHVLASGVRVLGLAPDHGPPLQTCRSIIATRSIGSSLRTPAAST